MSACLIAPNGNVIPSSVSDLLCFLLIPPSRLLNFRVLSTRFNLSFQSFVQTVRSSMLVARPQYQLYQKCQKKRKTNFLTRILLWIRSVKLNTHCNSILACIYRISLISLSYNHFLYAAFAACFYCLLAN